MHGDKIIVEEHHRRAAAVIAEAIAEEIKSRQRRSTITVAGESGSGKSETACAIAEALQARGVPCAVLQQDDYFVLPPKSNDAKRRQDLSWVGPQEVRLELLDQHLQAARDGAAALEKPLVIYEEDRVTQERLELDGIKAVIAEGTYTTRLTNVDTHIFINRNRLETLEARRKRGREAIEPFIEQVLEIEHQVISQQKARATIVITRDYDVEL